MQRVLAIAFLTLKAAFRFRLVLVLGVLLLGSVVALPTIIKDDGTARGFTQILLTYTLTTITALLGFSTLWLACGTLAREVEESQMQMVAVKPIARWQIWLGKWVGIMLLNCLLLGLSGGLVYGLLIWRAQRLPAAQQQILRDEILLARGGVREKRRDIEGRVDLALQQQLSETTAKLTPQDRKQLRDQIRERVKAEDQLLRPGFAHRWVIELGSLKDFLRDQPIYLRVKFAVTDPNASTLDIPKTFPTFWQAGVPETAKLWQRQMRLPPDSFHEFELAPNLYDDNGRLTVECINLTEVQGGQPVDMLFQVEDGLEVLYHEGGFGLNYLRGLGIIFCWLALLSALGLAAASFLSFPVAAFLSLGVLAVGLSSGTLAQVVEEGGVSGVNHDTGRIDTPALIDLVVVPTFKVLLKLVNLVQGFSPIDSLSTGRSISWAQLGRAVAQIIVVLGGLLGLFGMWAFDRRELAAAQSNQ